MSGSTTGAVQTIPMERRAFARDRFPGPHAVVDVDRLARSALREPLDPRCLMDFPRVRQARASRDGHVLVMHCFRDAEENYLEPLSGHAVVVHHGGCASLTAWTRSSGYFTGRVEEGQATVIPAGEPAFLKFGSYGAATLIVLRPTRLNDATGAVENEAVSPPLVGRPLVSDGLFRCIGNALAEELRGNSLPSASVLDKVSIALAAHLAAHYTAASQPVRGPLDKKHLLMVFDYVQSRLDTAIRLDELAALTGYSKHHFAHLFKATTGLSPMRYVFRLKMQHARTLVVDRPLMSITDVGGSVGYDDPAQFSRCFSRYWGLTASALRSRTRLHPCLPRPEAGGCGPAGDGTTPLALQSRHGPWADEASAPEDVQ